LSKYKDKLEEWQCRTGHEAANELRGQIAEVMSEKDFGYVMTKEGGLLYFHRNSVLSREFDKLRRGDEVTYVEDMGRTYCQQSSHCRKRLAAHRAINSETVGCCSGPILFCLLIVGKSTQCRLIFDCTNWA
jgi:hypothetical protein